ncbi:MAG TPA: hypothetical protein VGE46_08145 [Bdellovibrio sp.]
MLKTIFALFVAPILALALSSQTLMGFAQKADAVTTTLKGPLTSLVEEKREFLLAIGSNDSFYRFPKEKNQSDNRRIFQALAKSKKSLTVLVNANSREIYSIETTP